MDEKLTARAKLIYERDKNSPLFLRAAAFYIQSNEPDKAISILQSGQQSFSNHPLLYILLSKAYYLMGDNEKTELYLKKASNILDDEHIYQHYKKKFNLPEKKRSPFDSSRGNIFINSSNYSDQIEDEQSKTKEDPVDNNLKQIADKLLSAKIERNNPSTSSEKSTQNYSPDKSKLASETLAKIFISQGQIDEAIKIYEQLVNNNPEKKEYYLKKINELKFH